MTSLLCALQVYVWNYIEANFVVESIWKRNKVSIINYLVPTIDNPPVDYIRCVERQCGCDTQHSFGRILQYLRSSASCKRCKSVLPQLGCSQALSKHMLPAHYHHRALQPVAATRFSIISMSIPSLGMTVRVITSNTTRESGVAYLPNTTGASCIR